MRAGKSLPSWIRNAPDRARCIDELKSDDGFRSQFRSDAGASRSEVAIIDWGLSHIERLRKAKSESREAAWKGLQIWLVLAASVLGSIATVVAALLKKWLVWGSQGSNIKPLPDRLVFEIGERTPHVHGGEPG